MKSAYLWLGGALAITACAKAPRPVFAPAPPLASVATSLFLIGDAGNPRPDDPVLAALSKAIAADPARSVAVFLGDNIYPRGLPPAGSPDRTEMESRLDAQIDTALSHRARALFVPGNHDWGGRGGWEAVKRQGEYVARRGAPTTALLPSGGCPGPAVLDYEETLRLIALDTQWWLQTSTKPVHPTSTCPADSEGEVLQQLEQGIREAAGRRVVVVGHHPLASGGLHGGHFGWRDHIFPLRGRKSWLWIPLPGLGSLYPAARRGGVTGQDFAGARNRRMREAIAGVFARAAPLVYAAGHDHNLQVLKGKDVKYLLVSGAGHFGHLSRAAWTPATAFAREESGFMRLDVARDGGVRLAVIAVDARAQAREVFSAKLD